MKYVLGFLFDPAGESVVLIRKTKPSWQAGRLNGVGGKVEPGEGFYKAMSREFQEETGVLIEDWRLFGSMYSIDDVWEALLFTACSPKVKEVKTTTDEEVLVIPCNAAVCLKDTEAISNVPWLVAAARDCVFNPSSFKEMAIEY